MNKTAIEWAQNPDGTPGFTWNPITGCLKGCEYCYARKLANGRLRSRYLANHQLATGAVSPSELEAHYKKEADPFYPRFWPGKLEDVSPLDKPRGIFVCNMGELFGSWLPRTWTEQVMETISEAPQHRFYLLTKQPQELVKWSPFPPNCWVGATVTSPLLMYNALDSLRRVESTVTYLSIEPLLEPIKIPDPACLSVVDQIIIGAQTKPTVMPKIEWVREIVEAADRAGVKVFLKDSLWPLLEPVFEAGCIDNYFDDTGLLRQEMTEGVPCVV